MIAGYLLTGGKNSRMDGKKKLFLSYQGTPFYTYILHALRVFPKTYLSIEEEAPYQHLGLPLVRDIYPGLGPVGGIYTGLTSCQEEALFVTSCDMPLIDSDSVMEVVREWQRHPQEITIAEANGRIHPLFGIYPKSVLPVLTQMILEENYRVMNLLQLTTVHIVKLSSPDRFRNINTVKEYAEFIALEEKT